MFVSDNPENLGCGGWYFVPNNIRYYFDDNSPSKCGLLCNFKGYKYFGLKNGKECRCGHSVERVKTFPNNHCNTRCPGDQSKTCGGSVGSDTHNKRTEAYKFNIGFLPKDQVPNIKDQADGDKEGTGTKKEGADD